MGLAFGCMLCPTALENFGSTWKTLWGVILALLLGCGLMLLWIAGDEVNVLFTCLCQSVIGASTMIAMLVNLKHLGEEMTNKASMAEKNAFLAVTFGWSGLMAGGLCFLGDFLYYLNRNSLIWAYLESSAFPIGFLLVSAIF